MSIPATTLVIDALAARYGGTAYAVVQVARQVSRQDGGTRVVVVTRAGSIVAEGLRDDAGVTLVVLRAARRLEIARRLAWQAGRLPRLLRDLEADALLTFAGMLPRHVPVPVISYLLNPVAFTGSGLANRLRRRAINRTSAPACRVFVPSAPMADPVEIVTGRRPQILPLGVDHAVFRPAPLPGNDVLCVADFYPHKRHLLVLGAWAALPAPRPRLRFIGNPAVDPRWYAHVGSAMEAVGDLGEASLEGRLPLSDLVAAYRGSRIFVLASTDESFSMPVAEALACGVPCLLTDDPVLRDTGGPGCHYVSSAEPAAWTTEIEKMLHDDPQHTRLRKAGWVHAERYAWSHVAAAIVGVIPARVSPRPQSARVRTWAGVVAIGILFVTVLLAALLGRHGQRPAIAPQSAKAVPTKRAPDDTVVYGDGLSDVVPSPVPKLVPTLGPTWHRLTKDIGRLSVQPSGVRSRYFAVGLTAYSHDDPARLELLTSTEERALTAVPWPHRYEVITFGPLKVPGDGRVGLALLSVRPHDKRAGPPLDIGAVQAEYVKPGQAILRQPALKEPGPDGLRGFWFPANAPHAISFRVAPGVRGTCELVLTAVSSRGTVTVDAIVGGQVRRARVTETASTVRIGPFPRSGEIVRIRLRAPAGARVLVSGLRLRSAGGSVAVR